MQKAISTALSIMLLSVLCIASYCPTSNSTTVVSEAITINKALRDAYSELSNSQPNPDRLRILTSILSSNLATLYDLDTAISDLAGLGSEQLKVQALAYRAMAWLHGWAAFSQLIITASNPKSETASRQQLLALEEPVNTKPASSLGLLLAIHQQIRRAEGNDPEPLQKRLSDIKTDAAFALSYREQWNDQDTKSGITHQFYIPPTDHIVGHPYDPTEGQRHILSIWAVVNLQLDTWHSLAEDPLKVKRSLSKESGTSTDKQLGLQPLVSWLNALNVNAPLDSFEQATELKKRLSKIAGFLAFRQKYSDQTELGILVNEIATQRLSGSQAFRGAIPSTILEAARPLTSNGVEENLFDAEIWLRYVVLLSYHKERKLVADDHADNSLERAWQSLQIGQPFELQPRADRAQSEKPSLLRWNKWPASGHTSATLADLVYVAKKYLETEHRVEQLEKERFGGATEARFTAVGNNTDREIVPDYRLISSYRQHLRDERDNLQSVFHASLESYFITGNPPSDSSVLDSNPWAEPQKVASSRGEWGMPFRTSATSVERTRFAGDLAALAGEIQQTLRRYDLLIQAYALADEQKVNPKAIARSIKSMTGLVGRSNWNIYKLPEKTFDQYEQDLNRAIAELKQSAEAVEAVTTLKGDFATAQTRLQKAEFQLAAARVGQEIALKAQDISKLYLNVAEIDQEIAEVDRKIAQLRSQAMGNEQEAAGIKLALAIRARDLAAARVEALKEASDAAKQLAEQARAQLQGLAQDFGATAQKIDDAKARERGFGILKAIVSVVGAALAPFTGGASLAVAGVVNTAIQIYDTASQTDWHNFGSALAAMEDIGTNLAQGISITVNQFGSAADKKKLAEVSSYFKSTRKEIEEGARKLGIDLRSDLTVNKVLEGIRRLQNRDVVNFVSAVANGFTLTVGNNELKVNFPQKKLVFKSPDLQREFRELLDSGNIIVNDAAARARSLSKLPELPDSELKTKLYDAFKGAITQLPPEVLQKINISSADAQTRAQQSLERLKNQLETQVSPEERRLLAQALAGGFLFVRELAASGETVVLLERPITEEAARFEARLQAYKTHINQVVIDGFVQRFEQGKNRLVERGQRFASNSDPAALRQLAQNEIPAEIRGLDGELDSLQKQITNAEGELEDAQSNTNVADYEAQASRLFAQAGELEVQQSERRARRADLYSEITKRIVETSLLEEEKNDVLMQAALREVEGCKVELRRVYERCLGYGINPLAPTASDTALATKTGFTFSALLIGYKDSTDVYNHSVLNKMAAEVIGMIQWLNLLEVRSIETGGGQRATLNELYAKLISRLTSKDLAYVDPLTANTSIAGAVKQIATQLRDAVQSGATSSAVEDLILGDNILPERFTWRDDLTPSEQNRLLEGLEGVNQVHKPEVIGVLRFRVGLERSSSDRVPNLGIAAAYYAVVSETSLISQLSSGQNLSFLIQPPEGGMSHPGKIVVTDAKAMLSPKSIVPSIVDSVILGNLRTLVGSWRKDLSLAGALGEWQFYIIANGATPAERRALVQDLKARGFKVDSLRIGLIQVRLNPEDPSHFNNTNVRLGQTTKEPAHGTTWVKAATASR